MIPLDTVDAIDTLLGTARRVVDELRREGVVQRLASVLACLLPEEREALLQIIEHDAAVVGKLDGGIWSRFHMRPNPSAQLFTRLGHGGARRDVRYLQTRRAVDLGVRLVRALPPLPEGGWSRETLDAWRGLSPEEREYVRATSRRVLAVLRANRRSPVRV